MCVCVYWCKCVCMIWVLMNLPAPGQIYLIVVCVAEHPKECRAVLVVDNNLIPVLVKLLKSLKWCLSFICSRFSKCLLPLLWASSCDAELTATLHSEQYRRRRAFSSSVSASVSTSGSVSGSRSGSEGEFNVESPPAAEVVSGAVAAIMLGSMGEATGAGVGIVRVIKDTKGSADRSTGESGRGIAPGTTSAERGIIVWF